MDEKRLLQRISIDPAVAAGQPCIRGTRIMVYLLLELLAGGATGQQLIAEYPQLEPEDLLATFAYAADMARYGYTDLPTASAE